MARQTMQWIISTLRQRIFDTDSSIWTDDQLQIRLDTHRAYVDYELLVSDVSRRIFRSSYKFLEGLSSEWSGSGSHTDVINIWSDVANGIYVTPYSFNLIDGIFIFNKRIDNNLYLTAYSYDLYLTISDMLLELANDPEIMVKWSRGNVSVSYYSLLDLSERYRSLSLIGARIIASKEQNIKAELQDV